MTWIEPEAQRRTAADLILAAELMDVPDVEDLKAELADLRAGGLS